MTQLRQREARVRWSNACANGTGYAPPVRTKRLIIFGFCCDGGVKARAGRKIACAERRSPALQEKSLALKQKSAALEAFTLPMQTKNPRSQQIFHALEAFPPPAKPVQLRLQAFTLASQQISPAKQLRFAP